MLESRLNRVWATEQFEGWAGADRVDVADQEEVFRWLGQRIVWGDMEISRLVQVFYKFETGREARQESAVEEGARVREM